MPKTKKTVKKDENRLMLEVSKRSVFGKKLKKLRNEGVVPGNIYGPDFKSQAVNIKLKDFTQTYKTAKETNVVYLKLGSEEIPVLINHVQRHPVSDFILHTDFRKIDLTKKIQTEVPIKIVGTSEAITQKSGVLLKLSENLLVESLPENIPNEIEVDISKIKDLGQEIKVSDLSKSDKYEIKSESNKVVVSVVEHKEQSVTPETAPTVAPEVITAKPEEGVTVPGEGEAVKPSETQKAEEKKPEPQNKTKENKK